MRRAVIGFALGLVIGVLLVLGPHMPTESPWPAPSPSPSPRLISIDWDEEARKVAQMKCDTEKAQIAVDCKILWTGKPNPRAVNDSPLSSRRTKP